MEIQYQNVNPNTAMKKKKKKKQAQEHLHSVAHHIELEAVLGVNIWHECYACEECYRGVNAYAKHITTPKHNAKLESLISSNVKPTPLCEILSPDLIGQILERNKRMKQTTKMMKIKMKKKQQKQAANAAWATHVAGSNGVTHVNTNGQSHTQVNQQAGSKSAVVPPKMKNVSSLHDQSGTLPQSSQIWRSPFAEHGFDESDTQAAEETWAGDYNEQYGEEDDRMDFTSDELGECGAIVFEHGKNERKEEEEASAQRPAADASSSSGAAGEGDVTLMLRHIRRILGVREPCRADREARKQSVQAAAQAATQTVPAAAVPGRPSHVSHCPAPAAHAAKAKQTVKGPSSGGVSQVAQSSQTAPGQVPGRTTAKVRIAHKPASDQGEKETVLKATLDKLSSLYGGKKELTLKEMYTAMKRKTLQKKAQEMRAAMPRFGATLPKPSPDQGNGLVDLTLSEGFHWESVPGSPPDGHLDELPAPTQEDSTGSDLQMEVNSNSQTLTSSEQPGGDIPEIVEVSPSKENREQKARKAKRKRKASWTADVSEMESAGKKKPKSIKDRDLLEQLLDVSLKEEEVSVSLQHVDKSLVQARSTLQAAYLEVQRLILLKQQYTAEISSLRTQRIEILQGIQGGHAEVDNTAGEASTSSASISTQHPPPTSQTPNSSDLPPSSPCVSGLDMEETGEQQEHRVTTEPERAGSGSTGPKDEGDQSDDCVITVTESEPPALVVIDLDELDDQETAPEDPNEPQTSASSSAPQTLQQVSDDIKPQLTPRQHGSEANSPAHTQEFREEELSLGTFACHSSSIHDLLVYQGLLVSCSGDKTVRAYSLTSKECEAEFTGHADKVNMAAVWSVPNVAPRLFTGSSDQTICCFDMKTKQCLEQISLNDRVLCLHIAWNTLFAGLSKGSVASYDLKTLKQLDVFECHGLKGASCLDTGQEGARRLLLVGSYDSTISVRDAKNGLLLRSLQGHSKTVLCLQVVSDLVFSGSSDASVHAHNIHTGKLIRTYAGHGHSVTSLAIVGNSLVTACLDKLVRVYDLQSPDCLQVYGGQSGMVMCMAVLQNVVYTGCTDGSIQAFKLNLSTNYRCWWQNCSLVFGMADHLVQHVIGGHNKPSMSIIKCCWRGCSEQLLGEELQEHVKSHVDKDSQVQP